MKNLGQK